MGCLSIFNSNKIISNISANGALLYMVMYVRETFGTRAPNVLRRCAPYKGKALAPHGGYSCYVGGASSDSRAPKPRIAWSVGLFPRSILLVGISSQTLKTQNSRPRGRKFFGGAPVRALWFCVTAVTAVTMFYTFSLAVTAVTVVTCIYEFMGDSLCTYVRSD